MTSGNALTAMLVADLRTIVMIMNIARSLASWPMPESLFAR